MPTKPMGFFDQVGYSVKASKLSPAELRQEKAKVLGELRDAKTGAHKDPTAAANAQKKLDILSRYERPSCKPISHEDLKKYQHRCGQRGSGELKADIAKLRDELKQVCGKDPVAEGNSRSKLGVLEGALRTREGEVHKLSKWASCASDAELSKACDGYQKHLDHSRPDYGKTLENLDVVTCEQHKRCRGGDEARRPERPEGQKCEEQSLKDLLTDLVKNLERFHEATTGFDRDPKVAKDAMSHVREDLGELLRRVFQQALSAAA
ncbi:MAG: hypothetical protein IT380_00870 [Myxococcales bacterium]|nr:hypothetical protein [Myxococcales bacterium]